MTWTCQGSIWRRSSKTADLEANQGGQVCPPYLLEVGVIVKEDVQKEDVLERSLILEEQQRYVEALNVVREALKTDKQNRALRLRLAQMLELTKQLQPAVQLYRALMAENPARQEADLVIGLSRTMVKLMQYEEAQNVLEQLQEKIPSHPEVLAALACCKRNLGDLLQARKLIDESLSMDPRHKPTVHEHAEILLAEERSEEAVKEIEKNICREDLYGDSLDFWLNTLKTLNRDLYTQKKLEELVDRYPHKVEFIFGVGVLAHRNGEISIARPALEKAGQLSPNNYRILYELGVLERIAGNTDLSQKYILQTLQLNPENPAALRLLGQDYKYQYGDENFTRLNRVSAKMTDLKPQEQINIHYAQAKAFQDVEELDTAYQHFAIGGLKKRREQPYNEKNAARMFQIMPQLVNQKLVAASKQEGFDSDIPVFILGMPRSGTSLMEQILSSHPDIFGAGELKYMSGILENIDVAGRRLRFGEADALCEYEDNTRWQERGRIYVDRLKTLADGDYKRIVDKMPGNFNFVGLIHSILPQAKIIHSRRHPVETCLSCYRINFAEGQSWSYHLGELGRYYKRYWNLMKYWRSEFPGVMYEAVYEKNVDDVESSAKDLIAFLGLEWDENCLDFYNTDRPVKTASASQVKKPIYKTSTNRWRKYEKYLGPLLEEIGDLVEEYEAEISHLIEK